MYIRSTLILLAFVLVLSLAAIWSVYWMFLRSPSLSELEIEALAAAMRADTIGEDVNDRALAQDWVADVHLRLRDKMASRVKNRSSIVTSFFELFENVAPVYPDAKRGWLFGGRSITAIKRSQRYPGSPWELVLDRAQHKAKQGVDPNRCAEKYVRAEKRYDFFTGEEEAAKQLMQLVEQGKWRVDPQQPPELKMLFLCPVVPVT